MIAREAGARRRLLHDRKLYPNVDYNSGIIYEAPQIATEVFTVIFATPWTSGRADREGLRSHRPPARRPKRQRRGA
jgi:hypothetical protein